MSKKQDRVVPKAVVTPGGTFGASEIFAMSQEDRDKIGIDDTIMKLVDNLLGGAVTAKRESETLNSVTILVGNTTPVVKDSFHVYYNTDKISYEPVGKVQWNVSDPTVGIIDYYGLFTALKKGTVDLSATLDGITSDVVTVNVSNAKLESFEISVDELPLRLNKMGKINLALTPSFADLPVPPIYSSSDESIALVNTTGDVSPLAEGNVTLSVEIDGDVKTIDVVVTKPLVKGLVATIKETDLKVGITYPLIINTNPVDADISEGFVINTDNTDVVEVEGTNVIMKSEGKANLTVSINGVSSQLVVEPKEEQLLSIYAVLSADRIAPTDTATIDVAPVPINAPIDIDKITYTSLNENIATVTSGIVTAVGLGTTEIVVSNGTLSTHIEVKVLATPVVSFTASVDNLKPIIGETTKITNTVMPVGGAVVDSYMFTSGDENIATVDPTGVITAVGFGTVTIGVKLGLLHGTVTLEVQKPQLTGITLSSKSGSLELNTGENLELEVTVTPSNGDNSIGVVYSTSDSSIATVDEHGIVTGVKYGPVRITATMGSLTSSVDLTVKEVLLEGITSQVGTTNLVVGEDSTQITYEVNPTNADINDPVEYVSLDNNIAAVDATGKVTPIEVGVSAVGTKIGKKVDTEIVYITRPPVSTINVAFGSDDIERLSSRRITVGYFPSNAHATDITYTSSDDSIISIDEDGLMTANMKGEASIYVQMGTIIRTHVFTVTTPTVSGISFSVDKPTLFRGERALITGMVIPVSAELPEIHYTSSDDTVARIITNTDGSVEIEALKYGSVTITGRSNSMTSTVSISVTEEPLEEITFSRNAMDIQIGSTTSTSVSVVRPHGALPIGQYTYTSSDTAIVGVDGSGILTPKAEGRAVITVTYPTTGITAELIVNTFTSGVMFTSFTLDNKVGDIEIGKATYIDVITDPVEAELLGGLVLSVDNAGIINFSSSTINSKSFPISGVKPGTVKLTATSVTDSSILFELDLTVVEVPMTGITLNSNKDVVRQGEDVNLGFVVEPEDAYIGDGVTYSSSDETIATVNSSGVVLTLGDGVVTLTVTTVADGTITDSLDISVQKPFPVSIAPTLTETTFDAGFSEQIVVTTIPTNASVIGGYEYTSSNPDVISVDELGNVVAYEEGVATITITSKLDTAVSETIDIIVNPSTEELTGMSLRQESRLYMGESSKAKLTPVPANADISGVDYVVDNLSVAHVDQQGFITGIEPGITAITLKKGTVEVNDFLYIYPKVAVSNKDITGITLSGIVDVPEGTSTKVNVDYVPVDADILKGFEFTSSDETIAIVEPSGLVRTMGEGQITITVTSKDNPAVLSTIELNILHVYKPVSSIVLTFDEISIGETDTITVETIPVDADIIQGYTFTSSDESIATVTHGGEVTGVSEGNVDITVESKDEPTVSRVISVSIKKPVLNDMTVNITSPINVGGTEQVDVTPEPLSAEVGKGFAYSSSNISVATVDDTGVVTGISKGESIILVNSVDAPNVSGSKTIQVVKPVLTDLSIDLKDLIVGETGDILITEIPTGAEIDKGFTYTSSDQSVAIVDEFGTVSAISKGTSVIAVTSEDNPSVFKTKGLVVSNPALASIALDIETPVVGEETTPIVVLPTPINAEIGKGFTFSTSDASVAIVDMFGKVTGIGTGLVTVTVTSKDDPSINTIAILTVATPKLTSIDFTLTDVNEGSTEQIVVLHAPTHADISQGFSYDSGDESVATVDANGLITGIKEGSSTITVTSVDEPNVKLVKTINVVHVDTAIPVLTGLSINPLSITAGESDSLVVNTIPSNAEVSQGFSFTSSDESIVTVDSDGKVTSVGVVAGSADITVTSVDTPSVEAKVTITVLPMVFSAIMLGDQHVDMGTTKNLLSEIAILPPGSVMKGGLTYTSSDETIFTIDTNGMITPVADGGATVTVTSDLFPSITNTVHVVVGDHVPSLVSLAVGDETVEEGFTLNLSLTPTPSNAVIPQGYTYISNDDTIATVDANGLITGISTGTTTILVSSVDFPSVEATSTVTVTPTTLSGLSVDDETIEVGTGYTMNVTPIPANADVSGGFNFFSDDESIATVNIVTGEVMGVGVGTVEMNINSVDNPLIATTNKIVVTAPALTGLVTFNENMETGGKIRVIVEAVPASADISQGFTFVSSDEALATVDELGEVTGLAPGVVTIDITSKNDPSITTQATVTITTLLSGITIDDVVVTLGGTANVSVTPFPAEADVSLGFNYVSGDENVFTVDSDGVVTGVGFGSTLLLVTSINEHVATGQANVTVANPALVSIDSGDESVAVGSTVTLGVTPTPANAIVSGGYNFFSDDESIATVDITTGVVTGVAEGTVNIEVSSVDNVTVTTTSTITVTA